MIETWTNGDKISIVTNSDTTLTNFVNYKNNVLDVNDETKDHDNVQLLSYVISILSHNISVLNDLLTIPYTPCVRVVRAKLYLFVE